MQGQGRDETKRSHLRNFESSVFFLESSFRAKLKSTWEVFSEFVDDVRRLGAFLRRAGGILFLSIIGLSFISIPLSDARIWDCAVGAVSFGNYVDNIKAFILRVCYQLFYYIIFNSH